MHPPFILHGDAAHPSLLPASLGLHAAGSQIQAGTDGLHPYGVASDCLGPGAAAAWLDRTPASVGRSGRGRCLPGPDVDDASPWRAVRQVDGGCCGCQPRSRGTLWCQGWPDLAVEVPAAAMAWVPTVAMSRRPVLPWVGLPSQLASAIAGVRDGQALLAGWLLAGAGGFAPAPAGWDDPNPTNSCYLGENSARCLASGRRRWYSLCHYLLVGVVEASVHRTVCWGRS